MLYNCIIFIIIYVLVVNIFNQKSNNKQTVDNNIYLPTLEITQKATDVLLITTLVIECEFTNIVQSACCDVRYWSWVRYRRRKPSFCNNLNRHQSRYWRIEKTENRWKITDIWFCFSFPVLLQCFRIFCKLTTLSVDWWLSLKSQ